MHRLPNALRVIWNLRRHRRPFQRDDLAVGVGVKRDVVE
jgi:hypothetical protein